MTEKTVTTSTIATAQNTLTPAKVDAMLRDLANLLREHRRKDVVLEVVQGHAGPALRTDHPTDGTVVECGYAYAAVVNAEVPLRLIDVVSTDRARFGPVPLFPGVTFTPLFPPPYEVSDGG